MQRLIAQDFIEKASYELSSPDSEKELKPRSEDSSSLALEIYASPSQSYEKNSSSIQENPLRRARHDSLLPGSCLLEICLMRLASSDLFARELGFIRLA